MVSKRKSAVQCPRPIGPVLLRRLLMAGMVVLIGWFAAPQPAAAQFCSRTATSLDFGTVSAGASQVTGSTLFISCTGGQANRTIALCPYIGSGTGGVTSINGPRRMASGANRLDFDIFTDATFTRRYRNNISIGGNPRFTLTLNASGSGSTTITFFGRINAGQPTPPGAYSSNFITNTDLHYGYPENNFATCDSTGPFIAGFSFNAMATIDAGCTISTAPVTFPTASSLAATLDATGSITVTCASGVSYTVALNGGGSSAASATTRQMAAGGPARIVYGLFRDAARTQGWFNTVGTTQAGTGTGSAQVLPVYGRIGVQSTPVPGIYTDTIIATITY